MSRRKKPAAATPPQAGVAETASPEGIPSLLGSSFLPNEIDIGGPHPILIGEVIATAVALSGLSAEEWNAQPQEEREFKITAALEGLKLAAATSVSSLSANTEGASAAGAPAGEPIRSAEGGAAEPAPPEAGAAPTIVQMPVLDGETVPAFLSSPVRFGGKKHMPGRLVEVPAELYAELEAKGLIEEGD
ncbi:MAG: hypothetical protein ACK43M_14425 [Allorhizobium sp.]